MEKYRGYVEKREGACRVFSSEPISLGAPYFLIEFDESGKVSYTTKGDL